MEISRNSGMTNEEKAAIYDAIIELGSLAEDWRRRGLNFGDPTNSEEMKKFVDIMDNKLLGAPHERMGEFINGMITAGTNLGFAFKKDYARTIIQHDLINEG